MRRGSDRPFLVCLWLLGGLFLFLTVALVLAQVWYAFRPEKLLGKPGDELPTVWETLASPEIRFAIGLSLATATASALLSLLVAVPLGYVMSRTEFRGKNLIDAIIDVPIMLPPLVVGLGLLILFRIPPFSWASDWVVFEWPSVILAQFAVASAFAIRTMRVTFDQLNPRSEQVAMTLGCTRHQAFWRVVIPESFHGLLAAFTLAWARSLGEFGPILVFSGTVRGRTEVLSTSVFLEFTVGNLKAALAVSVLMIAIALAALLILRMFGSQQAMERAVRL